MEKGPSLRRPATTAGRGGRPRPELRSWPLFPLRSPVAVRALRNSFFLCLVWLGFALRQPGRLAAPPLRFGLVGSASSGPLRSGRQSLASEPSLESKKRACSVLRTAPKDSSLRSSNRCSSQQLKRPPGSGGLRACLATAGTPPRFARRKKAWHPPAQLAPLAGKRGVYRFRASSKSVPAVRIRFKAPQFARVPPNPLRPPYVPLL